MSPYFEQKILTAEPLELVRMLYQRAITCVSEARRHLSERKIAERSHSITQAYAVLAELTSSLKPEAAPALATSLGQLYGYMQQGLIEANIKQADAPLAEVLGLLTTLAGAWSAIPDTQRKTDPYANSWSGATAGVEEYARFAVTA
jgi:flagellar protein FliS